MIYMSKDCGKNCFGNNCILISRTEITTCDFEAFKPKKPLDPSRTCSSITTDNPIIQK
jgi:hypothetical protein